MEIYAFVLGIEVKILLFFEEKQKLAMQSPTVGNAPIKNPFTLKNRINEFYFDLENFAKNSCTLRLNYFESSTKYL